MVKGPSKPFEEIEELIDRMSRQFEGGTWPGTAERAPVDVVDEGDQFVVSADLPGYQRDDIELTLSNGTLRIHADREEETEEREDHRYIRRERRHRTVNRSINLPEDVDSENVKAIHKNGVLTVTIPKAEVDESQRIEIE